MRLGSFVQKMAHVLGKLQVNVLHQLIPAVTMSKAGND
jgi:hypothetical protein